MFVITDCTRPTNVQMITNDVKDLRDIVIGITGDETIGDKLMEEAGTMHFGDTLIRRYCVIRCVLDIEP